MRDGRTDHHGPCAGIEGGAGILRRMHVSLADNGQIGKFLDGLTQQRQIGPLVQRRFDRRLVVRQRGGNQIEAQSPRTANVLDGHAVGHKQHSLFLQWAHRILERLAVGTRAIGCVDGHDIGTGSDAGASMTQRRRDIDSLVPVLPQTDDRHLDTALDGRDVGKALAADGGRTPNSQARDICAIVSGVRSGSPG